MMSAPQPRWMKRGHSSVGRLALLEVRALFRLSPGTTSTACSSWTASTVPSVSWHLLKLRHCSAGQLALLELRHCSVGRLALLELRVLFHWSAGTDWTEGTAPSVSYSIPGRDYSCRHGVLTGSQRPATHLHVAPGFWKHGCLSPRLLLLVLRRWDISS
jgi:hypothetical protein